MASWTTIPNSEIAEGEPIRASTGLALRDNPIAIGEGRPGAPRLSPWAATSTVAAGDSVRYADMARAGLTRAMGTSFLVSKSVTIFASGTVRVKYQTGRPVVAAGSSTITTQVLRYRGTASTLLGEQSHGSGSGSETINRTVTSVDVLPGDSIVLQARFTSGDDLSATASIQNFTIETSGGRFWAFGGGSLDFGSEPT